MAKIFLTPVLVVAAIAALAGPRLTVPQDRDAKAPFVYTPPEGFVPAKDDVVRNVLGDAAGGPLNVWVYSVPGARSTPNITITHTAKAARVEDADLRDLALGMPAVYQQTGSTWTEVRHETRARVDGSRVGIIEGDNVRGDARNRVLQLVFPTDDGTELLTASFPSEDAAKWGPQIDATIAATTGVATRVPPVPGWMYVAWGVAGGVLAYLALALAPGLTGRRKKRDEPAHETS
jgi:hypothetical protein